jgi:membrane protease YdiL (CAAX protease family)
MHDPNDPLEPLPALSADSTEPLLVIPADAVQLTAPPKKSWPISSWIGVIPAWIVIVLIVLWLASGERVHREAAGKPADASSTNDTEKHSKPAEAATAMAKGKQRMESVALDIQGRYLVGIKSFLPIYGPQLYEQVKQLENGSNDGRLRCVVLAGELGGPEKAQTQLGNLDQHVRNEGPLLSREEVRVRRILGRLYGDYADEKLTAPDVSPADREELREQLGWFGDLALAPEGGPERGLRQATMGKAQKTAAAILTLVMVYGVLGFLGFCGLLLLLTFAIQGSVKNRLFIKPGNGGIYAETFALYMLLFIGLSLGTSMLQTPSVNARLLLWAAASLLSLSALVWPVLRGIPWRVVRQEIGLTGGPVPALEPVVGVAGYAMSIPLLAIGLVFVLLLMHAKGMLPFDHRPSTKSAPSAIPTQPAPGDVPAEKPNVSAEPVTPPDLPVHPIVFMVTDSWSNILLLLFLASVVAPIVEETMFRGVLHRHLRGGTRRLGNFLSIVISGTITSFIFAAIHPQGLIAVPVLMALAYGFTILREWRGSVVPGMVAHGLNNGIVLTLAIVLYGS